MIAYLAAQFIDVQLFHFWKRLTEGRHLWLRNNGSTLVSQLVDTVAVILITHYYAGALPMKPDEGVASQLFVYIAVWNIRYPSITRFLLYELRKISLGEFLDDLELST